MAIASDLDLYAIFMVCSSIVLARGINDRYQFVQDNDFPSANDMLPTLEELRPTVEVDERGGV